MKWLAEIVLRIGHLGPWAPVAFVLVYVAAAITMAPAFLLTVAAGALWGVWRGSALVMIAATLGASAAYAIALRVTEAPWLRRVRDDPRVATVRQAVRRQGPWVQFLLRLSPLVPYNLLNYALGFTGVRYTDFLVACVGMIPAIVMYTYYGKVVGDVAALAAGVAPPRGIAYYVLLGLGVVATVIGTTLITRASRRAIREQS